MLALLERLKQQNIISELNYQFAKMIDQKQQRYSYTSQQQNLAILLAGLISYNVMQSNTALRLDSAIANNPFNLKGKNLPEDFYSQILAKIDNATPLQWQSILHNHTAFSDNPNRIAPMLFQHQLLYFYRYWQSENRIANYLQQAVTSEPKFAKNKPNDTALEKLFPLIQETKTTDIDWQKIAVATALNKKFTLISGGPGTGKTTTIIKILLALQWQQLEANLAPLNIILAAPTGKATARLKESISHNLRYFDFPKEVKLQIPTNAFTLHRLLGISPKSDTPKYHRDNPLHLDVLVVDEASMIDLSLMEKMINALPPTTRLIMLGDKDQLASVEAGNIMSELGEFITLGYSEQHCQYLNKVTGYQLATNNAQTPPICDSLCHLRHSYRFNENSGIFHLSVQINAQQAVTSWQLFAKFADLHLVEYQAATQFSEKIKWEEHCIQQIINRAVVLYTDYLALVKQRNKNPDSVSVEHIFTAFNKVRFLSALRVGNFGVEKLNERIAEALRLKNLIHFSHQRENYSGKAIMITENTPSSHIYSGDIGLILPDEQGHLRVYFETTMNGKPHSITPSRLPNYEMAYIMTVHKSQGSEFEHTLLILPLTYSPILTKELLYTAITRAKNQFTLFGNEKIWRQMVNAKIQRQSGLMEQLTLN
ncbi:exodeoxyribonuclease V subunit alpha [Phocoenobacter skyensis]|uniref:RecBCD enzyme subunit RecD n=1 Tax=Phocoenobacter skyensis TaxID=97481 RepID=A0A1H7Z8K8_9PAST|nr:exodeoxyribonuclease V subunit alpha [Pasteurella skyensis]MDP8079499.1 exodeoxyribonuclease V subunit alpha [Pasteurella skyensis]MDP8085371.1 exodeoxyribonuclease V subunit alpha [Pasteurella skyensis]MDP8185830.1 exodeoxyribonuclease V subunit alpha [Pasteurella skyensis]QLB22097.1 exodeoxyribonuclease V subunit alpha [Pasteurella skyensis]SEM54922.1 DNA helicase/exodeoxyribonuclease V, alpha subunit [Pasteurella skyensis]